MTIIRSLFVTPCVYILAMFLATNCFAQAVPIATSELPSTSNSIMIESKNITDIEAYLDRHTLVVFDIDYTLFWFPTRLGSPEWSKYLIQKEMKLGKSEEQSYQIHYPAWVKAQQFNEIELLDQRLPKVIKDLKHKALGYIALTSRQGCSAEVTRWQLQKFDIDFSKNPFATYHYQSQSKYPVVYREGILFAHNFNDKGQVLFDWVTQVVPQLTRMRSLQRVVCIDDNIENLVALQKTAAKLNIDFVGIRYSAGDTLKKNISPQLVENERQILMTNVSDSETHLLLDNAGSYEEVRH